MSKKFLLIFWQKGKTTSNYMMFLQKADWLPFCFLNATGCTDNVGYVVLLSLNIFVLSRMLYRFLLRSES